jgi:superfamily II DNA helicase RecQ
MQKQFKAGYIADSVAKIINDFRQELDSNNPSGKVKIDQFDGLLKYVSSFDVDFPYKHNPDYRGLNPVLATLNNIITRGLPTRAPLLLENLFEKIGLTERDKEEFELNYPITKQNIDYQTVFELLHIVEPLLDITRENYAGQLGSEGEWYFLDTELKNFPFCKQILQSQRNFATINRNLGGGRSVDFSFEFPYHNESGRRGVIFEFDGSHHKINTYKQYDQYRDDNAEDAGFETLRQSAEEIRLDKAIENQFRQEIFNKLFKSNYTRNIENYLPAYSLIFIPLAVARIQKTLIEHFLVHPNIFTKGKISIAIIERDVPCGAIAIGCLKRLIKNINAILEDRNQLKMPEIELTVFENSKWVIDKRLHLRATIQTEEYFRNNQFDIIIDHSVLRRSGIYKETDFQNDNAIKIRSSHYFDTSFGNNRRVYCAELLKYKPLVEKQNDGSYKPVKKYEKHINFFIQYIFRKVAFREGQLPIISRALQQKPVIGLLPTGGGKSLTYQLPTFLQPGLCLIVDPIKSLMEDQVRVLKENWIDCCNYINSNLEREERAKRLIDFRYGETLMMFVSPERFVMQDFRDIVSKIDVSAFGLAFSYCVIDEVHCVSEWGHDFRPTYLMLGENAQHFCQTRKGRDKKPVTLVGLTATASFDVLADIERELKIQHDDVANAIIMIENTIRPELFFRVIDVTKKDRMKEINIDFAKMGKNLSKLNNKELLEKSIDDHNKDFDNADITPEKLLLKDDNLISKTQNDFCSIIFCPVRGRSRNDEGQILNPNGVDFVYDGLKSGTKGFFYSLEETDEVVVRNEIQKHFNDFLKGKIKHIVCTKAFGMGIDKADVRSVYHYFYSGSLESLVQEAGRAGRDKKVAEANILVSNSSIRLFDVHKFFKENIENPLLQNKFTRKAIRQNFERKWNNEHNRFEEIQFNTLQEILNAIDKTDFSLTARNGNKYNILPQEEIRRIREMMKKQDSNGHYLYIYKKYTDRDTHNFFYKLAFKGVDSEKSQFLNLIKVKEFSQANNNQRIYIPNQDTLKNTFEKCSDDTFQFVITASKTYDRAETVEKICKILHIDPNGIAPYLNRCNREHIQRALLFSNDFTDFLLILDESNIIVYNNLSDDQKEKLIFLYSRNREKSDTGKLIYRMHSMGLLKDYLIDYERNNLYICKFAKHKYIDEYVKIIEQYLRRYLSEQTAIKEVENLRKRLDKANLIDNILECLYYLSEFSYREIADKRKRATDEIEKVLNTSIQDYNSQEQWYEQNQYLKEQIYFYFNAKYARLDFKIDNQPYSLLNDYQDNIMDRKEILTKYLDVLKLDGTEQNNYKHLIGSCKKILRSLSETDLHKEWLLRLLRAFAMYAVNNSSYISEANDELELGFDNLYQDEDYHHNDFNNIEPVFSTYFDKLLENIKENNPSLDDIRLIRSKLLLKLQTIGIDNIIKQNNHIKEKYYGKLR